MYPLNIERKSLNEYKVDVYCEGCGVYKVWEGSVDRIEDFTDSSIIRKVKCPECGRNSDDIAVENIQNALCSIVCTN